ncbi:hypothetical protein APY03_7410 [Variovorax sp. WDL1]|nr:hypothetical protein APY03_7410 [Variovorax sp. WDL1]
MLEIEPVHGATILVLAEDFRIENVLKQLCPEREEQLQRRHL